jgi:hypothetical protein
VWLTAGAAPGRLAVVTETGSADQATQSAGHIWAELTRRYGPSLVLLEHHLAPQAAEGAETVDLVRIGADGSPHWLRIWPTPAEHPSHAGLELWMATYGHHIAGQPASWSGRCEAEGDLLPELKALALGGTKYRRRQRRWTWLTGRRRPAAISVRCASSWSARTWPIAW